MKKSENRKQAKKVRRRKRVEARQIKALVTSERRENSIKIRVEEYNKDVVSKDFVSDVLTALRELRLKDRRFFSKQEEEFWKLVKKMGFQECLYSALRYIPPEGRQLVMINALLKMGHVIFSILRKKICCYNISLIMMF